jgi:hypothetical protein
MLGIEHAGLELAVPGSLCNQRSSDLGLALLHENLCSPSRNNLVFLLNENRQHIILY